MVVLSSKILNMRTTRSKTPSICYLLLSYRVTQSGTRFDLLLLSNGYTLD